MTDRIKDFKNKEKYTLGDIRELVEILRSPDGCDWDREQTHASVRNAFIEETYEFVEGIDKNDTELMEEELGDVIFQVFFHARIAEENGNFNIDDVADGICKKRVLRHPHVFGEIKVKNSDEVLKNWETIKKAEKSRDTLAKQLESVSNALPSLIRAEKLLSRYKKEGGTVCTDTKELADNICSLSADLSKDLSAQSVGKLLFAVANLSYALKINSEQALYNENEKFIEDKTPARE